MARQLTNVLLLGASFHLIFFSFQTSVFIQQTVVNSLRTKPHSEFTGDGYISLCITYTVFALSNWLAPSIIACTGVKYGMFLGALTYAIYSACFIYPTTLLFYASAALIGLGAGPMWTAQGGYLAKNSDDQTTGRNAAIFWSMLQSSILFGNIFVYFAFSNQTQISDETRYIVYGVLTGVCALGALCMLLLRDQSRTLVVTEGHVSAWGQFVAAIRLAKTRDMLLLAFAFLFTGQLLSFFTGVFGTAIGATHQFGADAKKYIGLAGVCIGIGEIIGGSIFGLLGARFSSNAKGLGRDTIFVFGYLVIMCATALVFINLPPDSPLVARARMQPIIEPRLWLALLASVLIGFGDACFNTQIYSLLMSAYSGNSVGAFALFKFVQSLGSAVAFLYSTTLNLHYQLCLLAVIATLATVSFCLVEWRSGSASAKDGKQSMTSAAAASPDVTTGAVAACAPTSPAAATGVLVVNVGQLNKSESQQDIIGDEDRRAFAKLSFGAFASSQHHRDAQYVP